MSEADGPRTEPDLDRASLRIDDGGASVREERVLPVVGHYDVIVVGGGPAGVCAAVAAARQGARTALVERAAFLGGTATGARVASFMGFYWGGSRVAGGLALEIVERLRAAGGARGFEPYVMAEAADTPMDTMTLPLDPEVLKVVLDELVREAGVDVAFHTQAADTIVEDGVVRGIAVQGLTERKAMLATVVVDAGADGLIARRAGAELENRRQDPRRRQPMTMVGHFTNVDVAAFRAVPREEKKRLAELGMERGDLAQKLMSIVSSPHGDDAIVLMTRVSGRDGSDELELGRAEMEGRQRIWRLGPFLRAHVPGFERASLTTMGSWIGVRETWRVVGDYVLTQEDVLTGRHFEDAIAVGGGPLDVHHASGGGITLVRPDGPFTVPYRSLLPRGVEGLVVAGRCVSATHEAMAAVRHMGTIMCLGQAAGTAAALAAAAGVEPRRLPAPELLGQLARDGAILAADQAVTADESEEVLQ